MKTKEYKLENGITIRDSRELQCGLSVNGVSFKYFDISWDSVFGLYLTHKSKRIFTEDVMAYRLELESAVYIFNQINQLLNDKRTSKDH